MGIQELTESQIKTAKTCQNMFTKWQGITQTKEKTVAHYIKACIEGYPKSTKQKPNILRGRVTGIVNFAKLNNIKLSEKEITAADNLIKEYKKTLSKKEEKEA